MFRPGKIHLVMGGQWGSEAKGKLAGYLALREPITASVCDFMTNAGHWFRSKDKGEFLVQQIPMAAVNPNVQLYVGAGAAITERTLLREVEQFEKAGISITERLTIDPLAVIIEPHHAEEEMLEIGRISSTLKGCGAALASKVMRKKNVKLARDSEMIQDYGIRVARVSDQIHEILLKNGVVMGELAQGFDLSLNHGMSYPHVTSRDITPEAFMSNVGISSRYLGDVLGCVRTYPIRVGNVYSGDERVGYSGGFYPDQAEIDWATISSYIGEKVEERTTVTNKIRRVFTWSDMQYAKFVRHCGPTALCLQFCNYFPGINATSTLEDMRSSSGLSALVRRINALGVPIRWYGTAADDAAMVESPGYL